MNSTATLTATLRVWPGIIEVVKTGVRHKTGPKNALARALILSDPNGSDVIEIHGDLGHLNLCVTGNANGKDDVYRAAPIFAMVMGADETAVIRGVDAGAKGGGYTYLGLRNLTIDARHRQVGILGHWNSKLGALDVEGVDLLSDSKTKWGFRIHGWSEWIRLVDVAGYGGGQEHLLYVDHVREGIEIDGVRGRNWKRTLVQVVTRKESGGPGSPQRPPAPGKLLIANCDAEDCGAHGGFNFTVAGWPAGKVVFRDNRGESRHKTGLFVAYKDWKQKDLLDPKGFAIADLTWAHNIGIYPNGDREVNQIGSVNQLGVRVGDINGAFNYSPNRGTDFEGAGDPCGTIELHSRVDPNEWNWQSPKPFLKGKAQLTPDEVRALWVH